VFQSLYPPGPFGATPLTKGGEETSINLQVKTQRYRLIALSPITQGGMKGGFDIDMGGKFFNLFIPPAPSGPPPLCKGGEETSINLQVKTQRYRLIALSPLTQGGMKGGFDIDMGGKYSNLFIPPAPSGPPPLLKGVKKRALTCK
ncbi:MAG: hypothetical protein L6428_16200, partial [Candidatus Aminicenantes bacterium]|nr:hypothetical protein [Candidatus Aminicenantes bacterium]